METRPKDPDADLPFAFQWASEDQANDGGPNDDGWLKGRTLATSEWHIDGPDSALVSHSASIGDITGHDENGDPVTISTQTLATVWLRGGTVGERYTVTNRIVSTGSPPLKDDRSFVVKVEER